MQAGESEYLDVYISFFTDSTRIHDSVFKELLKIACRYQGQIFLTKEEGCNYQSNVRKGLWFAIASIPRTKAHQPVKLIKYKHEYYQTQFLITPYHVKTIITPEGIEFPNPDFNPTANELSEDKDLPFNLKSALQAGKCRKVYCSLLVPRMDQYTSEVLLELFEKSNLPFSSLTNQVCLNKEATITDCNRKTMFGSNAECLIVVAMVSRETELAPTDHVTGAAISPGFTKEDLVGFEIKGQFFANPTFQFDLDAKISIANQKTIIFPSPAQRYQQTEHPPQETLKQTSPALL